MSATTRDKLEFVYAMAKHTDASIGDLQRLMRYASTHQRLVTGDCNRGLTPAEVAKQFHVCKRITDLVNSVKCGVVFSGDPRGCTVKVVVADGYTNDMGREGICVPTA